MSSKISAQTAVLLKQKIVQMSKAKKYDVALSSARNLVDALPNDIEGWWLYSQLLLQFSKYEEAVRALYQVCQGPSPYYVQAIELASRVAINNKLWELAIAPAQELKKVKAKADEANYLLGMAMDGLRRFTLAMAYFNEVSPKSEHYPYALYRIGTENAHLGEVHKSISYLEKAIDKKSDDYLIWQDYLMILNYSPDLSAGYIASKHLEFGQSLTNGSMTLSSVTKFEKTRSIDKPKLRVGFVSADLRAHSVSAFMLPILKQLDLVDWDVLLYADVSKPDHVSEVMQSLKLEWVDMTKLSSEEYVERVRADNVDILIDLMGCSSVSRLREFAQGMAPIQVTYLGYPNTSGVPAMDYRITDRFADPESEENQNLYTEKLVHLPESFLCFESLEADIDLLAYQEKETVVFASFNNLSKYTDRMLDNWSEILKRTSNSRLLLKTKPLMDPEVVTLLIERFLARGIESDRLELLGWTDTQAEHLALYDRVDVHLDTFPYNGTTTTCEALWQGVPTVTLVGDDHRSRVSFSILSQLGMNECIAHTDAEFVEKAVSLSQDIGYLKQFKVGARDKMRASPLMDSAGFVKRLDSAFRLMVEEHNAHA